MPADPVAVDAGLLEVADALMDRVHRHAMQFADWRSFPYHIEERDLILAALQAAEERGAERMRERADDGSLSDFWTRHAAWSNATFGDESERGPLGPLRHLEKEAKEAQDAPGDILEYADCLLLVLDAVRRAGFTLPDLIDASNRKLAICQTRVWPKTPKDQAVEHIRALPTPEHDADAWADEAEAAQWRVFPNVHTVKIEGGRSADPFEGPGETYHDAYHREKARADGLAEKIDNAAHIASGTAPDWETHFGRVLGALGLDFGQDWPKMPDSQLAAAEARCDTLAGALRSISDHWKTGWASDNDGDLLPRSAIITKVERIANAALATIPAKPATETKP